MLHSYKILFPTHTGTFTMTLLKFWTLPTIKILPPLAPLLPIWLILSFPTHKFDRLDKANQSLSDPFFLLWICPCKILLFYYFAQKIQTYMLVA